jgi:uncharacterized protein YneF (UPF0154 family)
MDVEMIVILMLLTFIAGLIVGININRPRLPLY